MAGRSSAKFTAPKRYYRKRVDLFSLISKMKLWPARSGMLHGVRAFEAAGEWATLTTHCGQSFKIRNSRSSRAARWLRNKMYKGACPACSVPDWKLEKYGATFFSRHQGSFLGQGGR